MELVSILIGGMLLDLAFRGTEHEFAKQLEQDFGQSEFWAWAAALWVIGAIGAVPELRKASTAGLALVIVVLILKNGGFFDKAQALITNPPAALPSVPLSSYGAVAPAASSGGGGGGGGFLGGLMGGGGGGGAGQAGQAVGDIASVAAIALL